MTTEQKWTRFRVLQAKHRLDKKPGTQNKFTADATALNESEISEHRQLIKDLGLVKDGKYCYCSTNTAACNPDSPPPNCNCICVDFP